MALTNPDGRTHALTHIHRPKNRNSYVSLYRKRTGQKGIFKSPPPRSASTQSHEDDTPQVCASELCYHAKWYNDAKCYKFITFCVELKFFSNAKCYKILMATFLASFRFGKAEEVRKDVFSTDTWILTPTSYHFNDLVLHLSYNIMR